VFVHSHLNTCLLTGCTRGGGHLGAASLISPPMDDENTKWRVSHKKRNRPPRPKVQHPIFFPNDILMRGAVISAAGTASKIFKKLRMWCTLH
jgi:hypothetical protein